MHMSPISDAPAPPLRYYIFRPEMHLTKCLRKILFLRGAGNFFSVRAIIAYVTTSSCAVCIRTCSIACIAGGSGYEVIYHEWTTWLAQTTSHTLWRHRPYCRRRSFINESTSYSMLSNAKEHDRKRGLLFGSCSADPWLIAWNIVAGFWISMTHNMQKT